jgi:DUF4097 and DUF4098 domain-containing protein YvlB
MTRLLSPLVALLLTFALASPAAAQRETETVDRTLTVQPGGTVRLKTFSGRVQITGVDGDQVVIHAVRRATRARLQDITLDIQQSGTLVTIDANHQVVRHRNDNVVETDFEIRVPRQTTLDVKTFSAPVTIEGVTGPNAVTAFSADVRLAEVAGPAQIKTHSGNVNVRASTWKDGDTVDIKTFSGDVTLALPETAHGNLSFDSFSGRFDSSLPVTMQTSSKRQFRGQLNGGGATEFNLKTFSGSVTIAR